MKRFKSRTWPRPKQAVQRVLPQPLHLWHTWNTNLCYCDKTAAQEAEKRLRGAEPHLHERRVRHSDLLHLVGVSLRQRHRDVPRRGAHTVLRTVHRLTCFTPGQHNWWRVIPTAPHPQPIDPVSPHFSTLDFNHQVWAFLMCFPPESILLTDTTGGETTRWNDNKLKVFRFLLLSHLENFSQELRTVRGTLSASSTGIRIGKLLHHLKKIPACKRNCL